MKKVDEEKQKKIKYHWNDPEFDVIRRAFLNYVVCNGEYDDEYLNKIADLLGVSMNNSDDGYDLWWELEDPSAIKYIKID
jgi:hypothetical protein